MNGYPSKVVNKIVNEVRIKMMTENRAPEMAPTIPVIPPVTVIPVSTNNEEVYNPYICLPYKGFQGEQIVKKFRDVLTKALPTNVKPRIIFKGAKLGSCFRIKDKVPLEHETNLVYAFKTTQDSEQITEYVGETNVRFGTRSYEHCNTDKASSVYKHKEENNLEICESNFEIIDKGYSKTVDRKLAEALYVKELDPILNRQKKSFNLLLFN